MVTLLSKTAPVLWLLLFCLCVSVPALADSQSPVRVPLRQVGDVLVVPVGHGEAGARRFAFRLDTAAHETALYRRMVATLALDRSAEAPVVVQGPAGRRVVARYRVGALQVGSIRHRMESAAGLPSTVNPGEPLYGVLGQDFLLRFAVEVDVPKGLLTLHPRRAPLERHGFTAHSLSPVTARLVSVTVRIDGEPVQALIDTGAGRSVVNPRAARRLTTTVGQGSAITGVDGVTIASRTLDTPSSVALGETVLARTKLVVADLPVFRTLGMDDRPAMILGADVLHRRAFILDWQRMRLLVAGDAAGAP